MKCKGLVEIKSMRYDDKLAWWQKCLTIMMIITMMVLRSSSEIFVMTFGFSCPPCSFEQPYSCPVCAVISSTIFSHNLLLLLFHFILLCQGGLWHWVSKNVVGSELHVPTGLRRQTQRLNQPFIRGNKRNQSKKANAQAWLLQGWW